MATRSSSRRCPRLRSLYAGYGTVCLLELQSYKAARITDSALRDGSTGPLEGPHSCPELLGRERCGSALRAQLRHKHRDAAPQHRQAMALEQRRELLVICAAVLGSR